MIQTVNTRMCMVADCRTYRIENSSTTYDLTVSNNNENLSTCMATQSISHIFKPLKTLLIVVFLCNIKLAYDTNGIHGSEGSWLFIFFTKKLVFAVHNTQLTSKHKAHVRNLSRRKTTTLTTYRQDVNYLMHSYATDENKTDTEGDIKVLT